MAAADTKAEMKKAILEIQSLVGEFNSALDRASAQIEANDGVGQGLGEFSARSEELLAQLDRMQKSLNPSGPS